MPQYIACPNSKLCDRSGFIPSNTFVRKECEFCGSKVRKLLKVDGFLPFGWTTHELAENICRNKALILAQEKVSSEVKTLVDISNSQKKKFIRSKTMQYENEFFEKIKVQYNLK